MNRVSALIGAAAIAAVGFGIIVSCSPIDSNDGTRSTVTGRKARVVATTTMIADLVRNIGGPHVEVSTLMSPGVDPHQYKASAGDSRKMQQADLVVYNGLHLEGKMTDILDNLGKQMRVTAVASAIPESELRKADEDFEGTYDPHIWFDVSLWARTVDVVRDALIDLDPTHAADYRENANSYRNQLLALHEEVKKSLAVIAMSRRVLITAHDAFGYFGRVYDFEVRGLQPVSTNSEVSTRNVQELAKFIADRRIPAIFGETSVPDRGVQAVQEAVRKGWGFEVKFLSGTLYSDSLGNPNEPAGTYFGMIRHNVKAIVDALK